MKNRNKEIYMSIPEGRNREPQSCKKMSENSDRNLPGRVADEPLKSCGRHLPGWCNIKFILRSLCSESHSYEKMKGAEMPDKGIRGWNKTKTIPERSNRKSPLLFHSAFTLIELLVVVLIIGILAAIAGPQYQTAILKSKFATLISMTKKIADAEQEYYIANGTYTDNFDELNLDLTGWSYYATNAYAGNYVPVWVAPNGNFFQLVLRNKMEIFIDGYISSKDPFGYRIIPEGRYRGRYCIEYDFRSGAYGKYCHKITNQKSNDYVNENWYGRWFTVK